MLDELIKLLDNYTKNMNDVYKLRYIYIYLGSSFYFDLNYAFSNHDTRMKLYKSCTCDEQFLSYIVYDRFINCKSLSFLLEYIGQRLGLDISTYSPSGGKCEHIFNYVKINNRIYSLDLQRDLENIQTLSRTEHFCIDTVTNIPLFSKEELSKIDINLGYIKNYYTDEYLHYLKSIMCAKWPIEDRLSLLVNNINDYIITDRIGFIEYYSFLRKSILQVIGSNYSSQLKFLCFSKSDKQRNSSIISLLALSNSFYRVLMCNGADYVFKDASIDDMNSLFLDGYIINKEIPNVKSKKLFIDR